MQLTKYVGPLGRSTIYFVVLKGGSLGWCFLWSLGKPNFSDVSIYIIIYIYGTSPFIFGYTMGNSSYKPGLPSWQYIYAAQLDSMDSSRGIVWLVVGYFIVVAYLLVLAVPTVN